MPQLSNTGPTLARVSNDEMLLFFKGHNNDYIWESRYIRDTNTNTWEDVGRVHDRDTRNWAFTVKEPETFTMISLWPHGYAFTKTLLVYRGHNNPYVWYTHREYLGSGPDIEYRHWSPPKMIEKYLSQDRGDIRTRLESTQGPGVTVHKWDDDDRPSINVAVVYNGFIKIYKIIDSRVDTNRWSYSNLGPYTSRTVASPMLISFIGKLYCFYRGPDRVWDNGRWYLTPDYQLYYAVCENNNSGSPWRIHKVPHAYSTHGPTGDVEYFCVNEGRMVIAFRGHNNQKIWLRAFDGERWQNLGSVSGVETSQRPALRYLTGPSGSNVFFLAFLPNLDRHYEQTDYHVCAGELVIDWGHSGNRPGHQWRRSTGTGSCCVFTDGGDWGVGGD